MATNYNHFTKNERNELSILLKKGYSYRDIAKAIKRSPPSIGREIKRNMVNGEYDPMKADHKAYVKRKYSKYQGMKIVGRNWLESYVKDTLAKYWTPEEIAGRLELEHGYRVVTFKSIYKWLYSPRGQIYCAYLPSKRYKAKPRKGLSPVRTLIPNRVPIALRPNIINARVRVGDFEADTLGVPRSSEGTLAGMVDRKSRYFAARKIRKIGLAVDRFKEMAGGLGVLSWTLDNGVENVRHQQLAAPAYFCNAYSPWEKGTMENTFQRLRRFIPKKSLMQGYSDQDIAQICDIMNHTPRECLGYQTPDEVFRGWNKNQATVYQFIKNIINYCCT